MPLNDEQRRYLANRFKEFGIKPECPDCGSNKWDDGQMLAGILLEEHEVRMPRGEVAEIYPMIALACLVCGYIRMLNAKHLSMTVAVE